MRLLVSIYRPLEFVVVKTMRRADITATYHKNTGPCLVEFLNNWKMEGSNKRGPKPSLCLQRKEFPWGDCWRFPPVGSRAPIHFTPQTKTCTSETEPGRNSTKIQQAVPIRQLPMEQEVESSKQAEATPVTCSSLRFPTAFSLPMFRSAHKAYDRLEILGEANQDSLFLGAFVVGHRHYEHRLRQIGLFSDFTVPNGIECMGVVKYELTAQAFHSDPRLTQKKGGCHTTQD
eukprot:scaffold2611_cov70-Cylindrotheca_fusiformis.AAC.1